MSKGDITMSQKESNRIAVIDKVSQKLITARQGGLQLKLSERQIKRLVKKYRTNGPKGLISEKRGKPSNNRLSISLKNNCLELVRKLYSDFGPTLATEKLEELHDLKVSRESLRQWMIAEDLWNPKRGKIKVHQTRDRRACYGDLIQVDGSPHDWFEGRGPKCSLLVWIDDATSTLMGLRFEPSETTFGYLDMLRDYIDHHGIPVSIYSDKHSIFRQNHNDGEGEETQFTKALRQLEIEPIHANTPQAKGRVERVNQTLQDRLVKELRLKGISSIEAANAYLPEYVEKHNKRFAKPPKSPENAHRQTIHTARELDLMCAVASERVLSKNLTISFKNSEYQLQEKHHQRRLRGRKVKVIERSNGEITLLLDNAELCYQLQAKGVPPIPLDDEKTLEERVNTAKKLQAAQKKWKPAADHPFKKDFKSKKAQKRTNTRSSAKYYDHLAQVNY